MSTTTQILFNSPALHSLKREQLVKLCKIHSLKANGKNVEIIQRLRIHAQNLPKDSPLSIAVRSEPSGPIPIQPMENDQDTNAEDEMMREDISYSSSRAPRPSEQWEVVMDSIEEVAEDSSQGTLSSQRTINGGAGEFGTGSSKASTVSSSIKALASSLGLKRTETKSTNASTSSKSSAALSNLYSQPETQEQGDDLAQNSKPYASLPQSLAPPQTDHFTLEGGRLSLGSTAGPEESPLPGHALRPGAPAPANARLSLGLGLGVPSTPTRKAQPTTTIRLVSNPLAQQSNTVDSSYGAGENGTPQLKPFSTTFDITFGSPVANPGFNLGFGALSSWPPPADGEDVEMGGIYPKLSSKDLPPSTASFASAGPENPAEDRDVDMPGSMTPSRKNAPTSPPPFVFGSPNHNISNTQFRSAAASVLEEMNARLRAEGVDEISLDIVNKLHPDRKTASSELREIKPLPGASRGEITSKFDKAHSKEFNKMEGIDQTLQRHQQRNQKLSPEKKDEEKGQPIVGRKRKSSALEAEKGPRRPSTLAPKARASSTRVISNGRRAKAIPGGFGMEDDDDDDEEEVAERDGKRVRMDPEAAESSMSVEEQTKRDERAAELEKEKEAIKKKLEANRARRRSSAVGGRKSIGGAAGRKSVGRNGRPSLLTKPKAKPSRFGFLSSAKSLVQSVWNRGKVPAAPSHIPKPVAVPTQKTEPPRASKDDKGKMGPPSIVPPKKVSAPPAKTANENASGSVTRSSTRLGATKQASATGSITSTTSSRSRSRSPLPSFGTMSSVASGTGTGAGRNSLQSNASRVSSLAGTSNSRSSTAGSGVSSVGTRLSTARTSGAGAVGSMGLKKTVGSASRTSSMGTAASASSSTRMSTRLSTSSRLLAPTASSMAKAARRTSATPTTSNAGSVAPSTPAATSVNLQENTKTFNIHEMTLGSITNSPAINIAPPTPGPGAIFSKPLLLPGHSGIPSPVKQRSTETIGDDASSNATTTTRPTRALSGRKPRISRSKVIARLASQRTASGTSTSSSKSSGGTVLKPRASGTRAAAAGKTRSSLGAKAARASYGGAGGLKGRTSAGGANIAMSAKRRARQSEYLRRKSTRGASIGAVGGGEQSGEMEVDSSL